MADPKLYIIATPLGNRNDITLRALESFRELEIFFAEDSRELSKLLEIHGIPPGQKKIHSYGAHNMKEATDRAVAYLKEGHSVGFVSDRGTPGISDPGPVLVRHAREEGFGVIPIPGVSSVVTAMSVSGLSGDRFLFLGFVPTSRGEREALYQLVRQVGLPTCFFESPKRIRKTVEELIERFPAGGLFVGREMTKLYESYEWLMLKDADPEAVMEKGEFAIVLEPGPREAEKSVDWEEEVRLRLAPDKEWAKKLASRCGVTASEIYNSLQRLKNSTPPRD